MLSTREQPSFASNLSECSTTESTFSGNANEEAMVHSTESAAGHPESFHQNTHKRLLPGTTHRNSEMTFACLCYSNILFAQVNVLSTAVYLVEHIPIICSTTSPNHKLSQHSSSTLGE